MVKCKHSKGKGNRNERKTRDWYLRVRTSKWDFTARNDIRFGFRWDDGEKEPKIRFL